jgi:plasmid stabilization system protein ParE
VWQGKRRLRQLEDEVADARAEQASLRRRLELFEMIARAAGAPVTGEPPAAPMPPGLVAAAREVRAADLPVRLDVGGADVVAVIGGAGDPREWWNAIWQLTHPVREAS